MRKTKTPIATPRERKVSLDELWKRILALCAWVGESYSRKPVAVAENLSNVNSSGIALAISSEPTKDYNMRNLHLNRVHLDPISALKARTDERPVDLLDFTSLFSKLPKPEYGDNDKIEAIVRKALADRHRKPDAK